MRHLALLLLALALPAQAHDHKHEHAHHHHAHVHGQAQLEVAVADAELHLRLESPLEAVLGFERAPRNDKERAAVAALRQTLAAGERLFVTTAAAGCRMSAAKVESDLLDGKAGAGQDGHGDLVAEYRFVCAQPTRLTGLEVRLFEAFPKLRRLEAQVAGSRGQTAKRLTAKMRFLSW